jgi:hypothetical protein
MGGGEKKKKRKRMNGGGGGMKNVGVFIYCVQTSYKNIMINDQ